MRFMFMIILFVTQAFFMFGCGATMHSESTLLSEVDLEVDTPQMTTGVEMTITAIHGPPVPTERSTQRQSFASSMPAACDSHRARYVHRSVSTRDGMRVYCF